LLAPVEKLRSRRIALLSLEEKIAPRLGRRPAGFPVFSASAQFEQRLIAECTNDGIAAARARVKQAGTSTPRCR
jgi:DNA invertase Pin-like site-specific DNA recombinase